MTAQGGKLNGLDLFSGIGGLALALDPWVRPVAYCEIERWAQACLLSRMASLELPLAPIWNDVRTLNAQVLDGVEIDIVYGGFPCQDISAAGRGAGLDGDRSGLFFEIVRLLEELAPPLVFLENVPAIRTRGGERVGKELARLGYDCRWDTLSAQDIGAPHLRNRWFMLAAHSERLALRNEQQWRPWGWPQGLCNEGEAIAGLHGGEGPLADASGPRLPERRRSGLAKAGSKNGAGLEPQPQRRSEAMADANPSRQLQLTEGGNEERAWPLDGGQKLADAPSVGRREGRPQSARLKGGLQSSGGSASLADPERDRLEGSEHPESRQGEASMRRRLAYAGWWAVEPELGRVAHGVPLRVDRLRGLGNAVVPAQAREAFQLLSGVSWVG